MGALGWVLSNLKVQCAQHWTAPCCCDSFWRRAGVDRRRIVVCLRHIDQLALGAIEQIEAVDQSERNDQQNKPDDKIDDA